MCGQRHHTIFSNGNAISKVNQGDSERSEVPIPWVIRTKENVDVGS